MNNLENSEPDSEETWDELRADILFLADYAINVQGQDPALIFGIIADALLEED